MKKVVAILIVAAVAAFGGALEDSKVELVGKFYKNSKFELYGLPLLTTQAGLRVENDYMNQRMGALQNLTQKLGLPSGEISLTSDWANLELKVLYYLAASENEEKFYLKVYQYTSLFIPASSRTKDVRIWINTFMKPDKTRDFKISTRSYVSDILKMVMFRGTKEVVQSSLINLVLFTQLIDQTSNDTFAKKHFQENGLQAEWDKVRGELGL